MFNSLNEVPDGTRPSIFLNINENSSEPSADSSLITAFVGLVGLEWESSIAAFDSTLNINKESTIFVSMIRELEPRQARKSASS